MKMSHKATGIIAAAVAGAATGTVIALAGSAKKPIVEKKNSFTKAASNMLDTAGTVMLNMSSMLK